MRLRDGAISLAADGVRRRIPSAAIERIGVRGPKGLLLAVVLTGDRPVVYDLRCRSGPTVHEFAQAVRRALPLRDVDERRQDGAGLVTEEPMERVAPNQLRQLWWGLGGTYVLVFTLLVVTGAGAGPVLLWVVAPEAIGGGGFGVHIGWKVVRDACAITACVRRFHSARLQS
ncbi:hypothetical protein [Streptomyces sp. NPDC093970]|uniref:hypothetical protein n=1 Tax=Streptomyces sp. NPDC093970 TaxID=3155076 RepID=UPI00342DB030